MIIDCHTHFWRYPEELTEELARETFIMRQQEVDLDITPEMHASAVAKVDRAIVFGLRAPLTGFLTVNDTVAEYIHTDPKKLIGFAAICPTEDNALAEVDRAVQELGLRGLKMSPIYGGWDPLDPRALKNLRASRRTRTADYAPSRHNLPSQGAAEVRQSGSA